MDAEVPLYRNSRRNVGGHTVYAAVFDAGMGYRNVNTSGIATGDEPESMCIDHTSQHRSPSFSKWSKLWM